MAAITSNGTGGGNWSTGASWTGGSAPTGTDSVTIQSGDTITKDTAAASPDCTTLAVNGTLAIGSNGVKANGNISGSGTITMGDNGSLWTTGAFASGNTLKMDFIATSGNECSVRMDSGIQLIYGGRAGARVNWEYVDVDANSGPRLINFSQSDYMKSCDWDLTSGGTINLYSSGTSDTGFMFRMIDSFIRSGTEAIRVSPGADVYFENCQFGKTRAGSSATNSTYDFSMQFSNASRVHMHNTLLTASTPINTSTANSLAWQIRSTSHNQTAGDWKHIFPGGECFKSASAAKTGSFGIEFTPYSACSGDMPIITEIPIPVDSGDSVTPAIYYKNVTADMDLEAASGRLIFELDPGNEWGLNETIDASSLSDPYGNWIQAAFTGGTVGGTSKKGAIILRVTLARYVSTAGLYIADLTY